MRTTRGADTAHLQDLRYTYDPVGNITEIRDEAQQTIFFDNAVVSPSNRYEYDALYRLIRAEGREHIGQNSNNLPEHRSELKPHYDFNDITRRNLPHPHNGQAMRNYVEEYEYDAVGNIMAMQHQANGGNWTRRYDYATDSNRLRSTSLPSDLEDAALPERYLYDAHGNMTQMPHLPLMQWDFKDRLQASSKQVVNNGGTPEITYYVYDAGGQRVRKVTERQAVEGATPTRMKERLYLGGFEIYREYAGDGVTVTLERETLHIMDDKQRISLVETKTVDVEDGSGLLTPVIRYQLGNHLGSASLELDGDGAVISYEEYHPYGTTAYQAGRSVAEVSLKRYRYTGKERDEETGLSDHGARYYASWLGRWTAADPIGIKGGNNVYSYVKANPTTLQDPSGQFAENPTDKKTNNIQLSKEGNVGISIRFGFGRSKRNSPKRQANNKQASESTATNPGEPVREVVRVGATPRARQRDLGTTLRDVGNNPKKFHPGSILYEQYNLWSGGVNWDQGKPASITPGSGVDTASQSPGFIMEDTSFEEQAEQLARRLGHADRFSVPFSTNPNSDFHKVWGPASDRLAVRAGLSITPIQSHGLSTHPNPDQTVQVTREIPRIQGAGGVMAQFGKITGILTIAAASEVDDPVVSAIATTAGALEFIAGNIVLYGLTKLGTSPASSTLMAFGRTLGGIAGGVGMAVLSAHQAYQEFKAGDYTAAKFDAAAALGGAMITLGAIFSAPVLAGAGALLGVAALGYHLGRWLGS